MGQTHPAYLQPLLDLVQEGKIDPRLSSPTACRCRSARATRPFKAHEDGYIKVVLKP
ncbi:MAG: hypothetical protein U0232_23470 [Thermomicrobiales bacterium]